MYISRHHKATSTDFYVKILFWASMAPRRNCLLYIYARSLLLVFTYVRRYIFIHEGNEIWSSILWLLGQSYVLGRTLAYLKVLGFWTESHNSWVGYLFTCSIWEEFLDRDAYLFVMGHNGIILGFGYLYTCFLTELYNPWERLSTWFWTEWRYNPWTHLLTCFGTEWYNSWTG